MGNKERKGRVVNEEKKKGKGKGKAKDGGLRRNKNGRAIISAKKLYRASLM